tara:strand:- start:67 stop:795 length:729 start_codon:yes stop_codon:yes gene_type:complete
MPKFKMSKGYKQVGNPFKMGKHMNTGPALYKKSIDPAFNKVSYSAYKATEPTDKDVFNVDPDKYEGYDLQKVNVHEPIVKSTEDGGVTTTTTTQTGDATYYKPPTKTEEGSEWYRSLSDAEKKYYDDKYRAKHTIVDPLSRESMTRSETEPVDPLEVKPIQPLMPTEEPELQRATPIKPEIKKEKKKKKKTRKKINWDKITDDTFLDKDWWGRKKHLKKKRRKRRKRGGGFCSADAAQDGLC